MTPQEKKETFARVFPRRVEKLIDGLRVLGNCSNKSGYTWDQATVHDTWVQIGIIFCQAAASFGVEFKLLVDGEQVEYAKRKSTRS